MSQFYVNSSAAPPPPSVPTSFLLDDGNSAVPAANVIQVNGLVGASTSLGAGNQIYITVKNDGFAWSEQNASFPAVVQNGYFCNLALTVTLPATAGLVIGNTVIVYADTTQVVTIQANTGQFIQFSGLLSASGGTVTSNTKGALLELVFKPSDSTWHSISSQGSWTTI